MSTERLFIAIALPDVVRRELAAQARPLPGITWTRPEQLHLTLRFLGDVPVALLEPLATRLAAVRVEPFILPVAGVGSFPPKRSPHVLWCGVGRGHTRLHQLRQRLDDAILGAGLNPDLRTFSPHITLARCGDTSAEAAGQWLQAQQDFEAPPFRVASFNLYASELTPDGATHTLQQSFAL